ncbi:rhodanese-like domain-containing protein [Methylosinus sp. H3A]|uniref:rhodanese-like domain-containing protein n=1 Tax=Methylosinus sp. H3A TaxID=2785786 RepID=UPI0018C28616|nr:rhodanese-like domain-containing protein [Methylosinus sp. H3A]MBG0812175.1 rhodanese-like domain-containing protein [Methylosinus sp. H3A]
MADWYNEISLEDLKSGIADKSIILVDVREADEYAQGHIDGALFVPLSAFDPTKIPTPAEGQKVVIYCRSGKRSVNAMEQARLFGRRDVSTHFGGGIIGWQKAGEPVVTGM